MPRKLTDAQRDVLIDHLDGIACRYVVPSAAKGRQRKDLWRKIAAARGLVDLGYLEKNRYYTTITDAGREALASLLGEYADALLRASYGQDDSEYAYPEETVRRVIYPDGRREEGRDGQRDRNEGKGASPPAGGAGDATAQQASDDGAGVLYVPPLQVRRLDEHEPT